MPPTPLDPFLVRLRNLRQAEGLSQAAAAERVGVHTESVSRWERGAQVPDLVQLDAYLTALAVNATDARDHTYKLRREYVLRRAAAA